MKDKIGQEITVGCFIAYGHNLDRSAGLRIGRVEAIKDNGHITVLGIDDDWASYIPRLLTKRSTLQFPNRTILLPFIPDNYRALYTKDCVANGGQHTWKEISLGKKCTMCGLTDGLYI